MEKELLDEIEEVLGRVRVWTTGPGITTYHASKDRHAVCNRTLQEPPASGLSRRMAEDLPARKGKLCPKCLRAIRQIRRNREDGA